MSKTDQINQTDSCLITFSLSFKAEVVLLTTLLASDLTAVENSSKSRFTNSKTSTDWGKKRAN